MSEAVDAGTDPHDVTADDLVDLDRILAGEHPDREERRPATVAQDGLATRLHLAHVHGSAG